MADVQSGFLMPRVSTIAKFRRLLLRSCLVRRWQLPVGMVPVARIRPSKRSGCCARATIASYGNASAPASLSVNRRQELATGQHPAAMVVSCADSRVPPEHVFNVGLGDLTAAAQTKGESTSANMGYLLKAILHHGDIW